MNRDVFSTGEAEFLSFASAFHEGTNVRAALPGIPSVLASDNQEKLSACIIAYRTTEAPNAGKIDREDRKEKRGALTQNMRKIKNAYLDADPLGKATPEILTDFGLQPKDRIRTDVPDPAEAVPFTLESGEYPHVTVKHPARRATPARSPSAKSATPPPQPTKS
ncbi:MAG: hypothetical protein LBK66_12490 [Spirochaetaceae bacterium]|jgi:hypothetical protein|nr:hypothetical protein [Spirochaetaceae bacterium]